MHARAFSDDECQYLTKNYGKQKAEYIASVLNRSCDSIRVKASRMNLSRRVKPNASAMKIEFINDIINELILSENLSEAAHKLIADASNNLFKAQGVINGEI